MNSYNFNHARDVASLYTIWLVNAVLTSIAGLVVLVAYKLVQL